MNSNKPAEAAGKEEKVIDFAGAKERVTGETTPQTVFEELKEKMEGDNPPTEMIVLTYHEKSGEMKMGSAGTFLRMFGMLATGTNMLHDHWSQQEPTTHE